MKTLLRQAIPMGRGRSSKPRNTVTHATEQDASAGSSGVLRKLCLALMVSSSILAPVSIHAEAPKLKPAVSEKARGDFWKAAVLASQADAAKIAADNNKKTAVEAMQKECGDWELQQDPQTFEPICVERPKPAALATPAETRSSVAEQKEKDAQIDAQAKAKEKRPTLNPAQQRMMQQGPKPKAEDGK